MTTTPIKQPIRATKLFGFDRKAVLTVLALVVFVIAGLSGVLIAQRQRQISGPVAPTAPGSRPQAAFQQLHTCTVALTVPNPIPTPTPFISPSPSLVPTPTPFVSPSPSLVPTPIPTPTPTTYSCNSSCTTNAQCQTANAAYICSSGKCRLNGNVGSTTCTYKCNSSCVSDAECQTVNPDYICSSGKCRMKYNPNATNCSYSCPVINANPKPPVTTCAPAATETGTITWYWTPISGHNSTTQYQIQVLNSNNQVVGEDKGCKPGDEYYNCYQGHCSYTSYHLPGTYKARIKACTSSCPSTTTQGFRTTVSKTIGVCQ